MYLFSIASKTEKHCDIAHIIDPAERQTEQFRKQEENTKLGLGSTTTSLTFDLIAGPNHKGHIVGPDIYCLDLIIAATNAKSIERTIEINLRGCWFDRETEMFDKGICIREVANISLGRIETVD